MFGCALVFLVAGQDSCMPGDPTCSQCPCIDSSTKLAPFVGQGDCKLGFQNKDTLEWLCLVGRWSDYSTPPATGEPHEFYGNPMYGGGCLQWDIETPKFCYDPETKERLLGAETWCEDSWCYVDPDKCSGPAAEGVTASGFFPACDGRTSTVDHPCVEDLYYSYETCGGEDSYTFMSSQVNRGVGELVAIMEDYALKIRKAVRSALSKIAADEGEAIACPYSPTCDCSRDNDEEICGSGNVCCEECGDCAERPDAEWQDAIDLTSTAMKHPSFLDPESHRARELQCVHSFVRREFRSMVQREMTNPNRIAYLYFGHQSTGGYFQWPGQTGWCGAYDPRMRPWYAIAASGPKDMVIIADISGSMRQPKLEPRWDLAKEAMSKLLTMTTQADHVAIVGFHDEAETANPDNLLLPMTEENLFLLEDWLDWTNPVGGTNFWSGLELGFQIIDNSVREGKTSGCSTAIFFLTDGADKSGYTPEEILQNVRAANDAGGGKKRATIFTYSFGEDAEDMLPKKIACQNEGIWYKVQDGGDLADTMAQSYQFYTTGGIEAERIRWVLYEDIITGTSLLSACLPVHESDDVKSKLYGVVCLDLNLIISIKDLKEKPEWPAFWEEVLRMNGYCLPPPQRTAAELQGLRGLVHESSTCRACDYEDDCTAKEYYDFDWSGIGKESDEERGGGGSGDAGDAADGQTSAAFAVSLVLSALS